MSDYGVVTEPGTVRLERRLPGPIDRVWRHLTDAELRGRWLATGPLEPRVGGTVELHFRNNDLSAGEGPPEKYRAVACDATVAGRVTSWEPPRRLGFTWAGDSEVTFELSPEEAGVRLVVTHRRLAARDAMLSVSAGWHTHLDILKDRLEGEAPRPFWSNHTRLQAEYERLLPAA